MNVTDLSIDLQRNSSNASILRRWTCLSKPRACLYISPELFVQIYRNDRFHTTNLALIYNGNRLFAHDELDGKWHRQDTGRSRRA